MDLTALAPTRIVLAPMAGGVGTPALAAAVSSAGGLGFLPGGYLTATRLAENLAATRAATDRPFGVNLFVPEPADPAREAAARRYAAVLARRLPDRPLGEPRYSDDEYDAKLAVVLGERPALVSFTFGLPAATDLEALHAAGVATAVTVTSVAEARAAADAGAQALVVQGWEAGAHRGSFRDEDDDEQPGLLPLLRLVRAATTLPLVGAGGLADGAGVAAVLAAGAEAAMLGTAFLRCPEAGTAAVHAAALAGDAPTTVTRAFTGRRARALATPLVRDLSPAAPRAYPETHYLTGPLRADARERGDAASLHLWAGQAHALGRDLPAGDLVAALAGEARAAAARLDGLLGR